MSLNIITTVAKQVWYSYRDTRYIQMAKEWCQENNILGINTKMAQLYK